MTFNILLMVTVHCKEIININTGLYKDEIFFDHTFYDAKIKFTYNNTGTLFTVWQAHVQ